MSPRVTSVGVYIVDARRRRPPAILVGACPTSSLDLCSTLRFRLLHDRARQMALDQADALFVFVDA